MRRWLRRIFSEDVNPKKNKPIKKPQRKIGINKNYDPDVWQKNRFKQIEIG